MSYVNISLQRSNAVVHSQFGQFALGSDGQPQKQQLLVMRPNSVELYKSDDTGKLTLLHETPLFCVVRSCSVVRMDMPVDSPNSADSGDMEEDADVSAQAQVSVR